MTQTVMKQDTGKTLQKKDVRVTLKRKEVDHDSELEEMRIEKRVVTLIPFRSRINADQELWNQVSILERKDRTSGVIPRLETNFKKGDTQLAYLCSPFTDHLSTGIMDLGWGCGYRNCQMLMSFLERQKEDGESLLKNVLDISGIQWMIEKAWDEGFDGPGASQFNRQVFKTRKWIGTTEVYTLFAYLGIRSTIIDFHQPGPEKLLDWIQSYFSAGNTPTTSTTLGKNNHRKTVYITNKPPLYLQHQGHSRTVIGIEILKNGKRNLIMFDPGRRILRSCKSKRNEQEEEVEQEEEELKEEKDVTESEDEEIDILNHDNHSVSITAATTAKKSSSLTTIISKIKNKTSLPSRLLQPFRVDAKTIAKHKQYSILVLGQVNYQDGKMVWDSQKSYLLNEQERRLMKNVTSLTDM